MGLPIYSGAFEARHAERLLWRAGFGPRPGEAEQLAAGGLDRAVASLTSPGPERLVGPAPRDQQGRPIAPYDAWGHDHLWWLDRMVRTSRPLVERMTLVWHDWFATSNDSVNSQRLMLRQNALLRDHALGSFAELLPAVTKDPAMLIWLSGTDNTKDSPNENYARELMELFTLGADRKGGYSERDVREQARALTGWQNDWKSGVGPYNFRFDPAQHDAGGKIVFGRRGAFDWQDACKLCLGHPNHASFFVGKLWSYFVPTVPGAATVRALAQQYTTSGYEVKPVLDAILRHPDLHEGPSMVKPPAVYTAGILRMLGRGIDTSDWAWLDANAGQQLFYPPNVAGWDADRWLDTATFRGRWEIVNYALKPSSFDPKRKAGLLPLDEQKLLDEALLSVGGQTIDARTRSLLLDFGRQALADANENWKRGAYPVLVYNAMRQLLLASPEAQTC